ncbi:MAG: hypothetical protein NC918_08495 [Candidatus Omnitrophica bacterium]|nr:hypothetical protein [Candidatus Omnitrophota bacterium]
MNKKSEPLIAYNLDSERIKEAFFSPPKKKHNIKKKKNPSTKKYFFVAIFFAVSLFLFIFFVNYDFLIIPKNNLKQNIIQLLQKDFYDIKILVKKTGITRTKKPPIYINLSENSELIIDLKKTINLNENLLFLYIKKSANPINIAITVRDEQFFSNSLNPYKLTLEQTNNNYIKVPLDFGAINVQNTNLKNISQIKFSFYPVNSSLATNNKYNKNWILFKNLFLIKKEVL